MILRINKSKYIKGLLLFGLLSFFFSVLPFVIIFSNLGKEDPKRWLVLVLCIPLAILFVYFLLHLLRVRKNWNDVLSLENGELTDYTGAIKCPKIIPLTEMIECNFWQVRSRRTLKIKRRHPKRTGNVFINQLNGADVYITDALVDSKEFEALVALLRQELEKVHAGGQE